MFVDIHDGPFFKLETTWRDLDFEFFPREITIDLQFPGGIF